MAPAWCDVADVLGLAAWMQNAMDAECTEQHVLQHRNYSIMSSFTMHRGCLISMFVHVHKVCTLLRTPKGTSFI